MRITELDLPRNAKLEAKAMMPASGGTVRALSATVVTDHQGKIIEYSTNSSPKPPVDAFDIVRLTDVRSGATVPVRELVTRGPSSMRDDLLFYAVIEGSYELLEELLEGGYDPNQRHPRNQGTPLHHAAGIGHAGKAILLLERGADVNAIDHMQMTPLHVAVAEENRDLVRLLLQQGADVTLPNSAGETPVDLANRYGISHYFE